MPAPSVPLIKIRPVAASGQLTFYWAAPASDGGSAITSYTLTCDGRSDEVIADPATRFYAVSGLTNGTSYTFSLYASNADGAGPAATFRTVEPGSKPSDVQSLTVEALGEDGVTLNWSAPASDGGADIGWYVVKTSSSNGSDPVLKKSRRFYQTSCKLAGLNTGSDYTLNVRPVNDPGYGPAATIPFSFALNYYFQQIATTPLSLTYLRMAISADGETIYATAGPPLAYQAGAVRLYKSTDAGSTWKDISAPFRSLFISSSLNRIACDISGTTIAIPSGASGLSISTNGGVSWAAVATPISPSLVDVSADASRIIIAASGIAFIQYSTNSGANWTEATSAGSRAWSNLFISRNGTTMVGMPTSSGTLWISTDSGANWSAATGAGTRAWIDVAISDDGTKIAAIARAQHVWMTTNSGGSWSQQTNSGQRQWNTICMSGDGTKLMAAVYLSTNYSTGLGYVYSSSDTGATWTEQTSGGIQNWGLLRGSSDLSKVYSRNGALGILKTTNYGSSFTRLTNPVKGANHFATVVISSDGTKMITAATAAASMFTSADSGNTWNTVFPAVSGGPIVPRIFQGRAMSSDGAYIFFAEGGGPTGSGGIWRSTDFGATWTQAFAGTSFVHIVCSPSGQYLIATSSSSVLRYSSDYGASWTLLTLGYTITTLLRPFISSDGNTLALNGIGGADAGYIYTSTNAGATWTQQAGSGPRGWTSPGIVGADDASILYAVSTFDSIINISTDVGVTWTAVTAGGSANWANLLSSANGSKLVARLGSLTTGRLSYILTSGNRANTWSNNTSIPLPRGNDVSAPGITPTANLCVVPYGLSNGGYLYRGTTTAPTWVQRSPTGGSYGWGGSAMSADGQTIYVCAYNGSGSTGYIYKSVNGGATWTEVTSAGQKQWYGITCSADGTFVAATKANTTTGGGIFISTNGGANWTEQGPPSGSIAWGWITCSQDGNVLIASAFNSYVYRSLDGGLTWSAMTDLRTASIWTNPVIDIQYNARWYIGKNGEYVYVSTDYGNTWSTHIGTAANWKYLALNYPNLSSYTPQLYAVVDGSSSIWINGTENTSTGMVSLTSPSVACSADGITVYVANNDAAGKIYKSSDSGSTFTLVSDVSPANMRNIACSATGESVVTAQESGYVFVRN